MKINTDFYLDVKYLKAINNELNILEYMKKILKINIYSSKNSKK